MINRKTKIDTCIRIVILIREGVLMRTEERVEGQLVKVSTDESSRCSVVYSEVFAERKKKKEYKNALSQILQRARKLDW